MNKIVDNDLKNELTDSYTAKSRFHFMSEKDLVIMKIQIRNWKLIGQKNLQDPAKRKKEIMRWCMTYYAYRNTQKFLKDEDYDLIDFYLKRQDAYTYAPVGGVALAYGALYLLKLRKMGLLAIGHSVVLGVFTLAGVGARYAGDEFWRYRTSSALAEMFEKYERCEKTSYVTSIN